MPSPRSHSTIRPTVPPEIQRAAADILILTDPPTAASTHLDEYIQSDKYLGVVLDNRLSFNKNTDQIVKTN